MTTEEMCRKSTESHLRRELENVANGYMYVYDEYYKTFSRDSAFLKDATDAIIEGKYDLLIIDAAKSQNMEF